MNRNDVLKPLHLIIITTLFNTSTILVFKGFTESGKFHFITPFFAGSLALICSLSLFSVGKRYPGKNIYEVMDILFPKWLSRILGGIYAAYALYLLSRIIKNTGLLITTVSLDKTPQILLQIFILALCIYALWYGISVFGRFTILSGVVTLITVAVVFIMSLDNIDTESFLPIVSNGLNSVLSDIFAFFIIPFAENIMLYNIYAAAENKGKSFQCFAVGIGISTIVISAVSFLTLSVLGLKTVDKLYYPFYTTVSVIKSGNFLSRMEVFISASLVLNLLTKICVCFYAAVGFLEHLNKFKDYLRYLMVAAFSLLISLSLPSTTAGLSVNLGYYQIIAPCVQIGIPVIIVLGMIIKNRKTKSNL